MTRIGLSGAGEHRGDVDRRRAPLYTGELTAVLGIVLL